MLSSLDPHRRAPRGGSCSWDSRRPVLSRLDRCCGRRCGCGVPAASRAARVRRAVVESECSESDQWVRTVECRAPVGRPHTRHRRAQSGSGSSRIGPSRFPLISLCIMATRARCDTAVALSTANVTRPRRIYLIRVVHVHTRSRPENKGTTSPCTTCRMQYGNCCL
jgi:hypothetical protein